MPENPTTIDQYILAHSPEVQWRLEQIRQIAKDVAPEAIEDISYGVAAWRLVEGKRAFVFSGGYPEHVSIYPVPQTDDPKLQKSIDTYQAGKGTLKFSNDQDLPIEVIRQVVKALYDQAKKKGT